MKQFFKLLAIFFGSMLLLGSISVSAEAAVASPGKVSRLTAKNSDGTINLKWSKVSKANGYYIYRVNPSTGAKTRVAKTGKTSYSIKKLSHGATYQFQVYAYRKSGKKDLLSKSPSPSVKATAKYAAPTAPTSFSHSSSGDKSATLKWSGASRANGYVIYKYDPSKKTYVEIKRTTGKTITFKNLSTTSPSSFRIRSYRKVKNAILYSGFSKKTVSLQAKAFSSDVKSVTDPRYKVKLKKAVTVTDPKTKKAIKLAKGTKLETKDKTSNKVNVYLSNERRVALSRSLLSYYGLTKRSTDYSRKTKEDYVNSKGFGSQTKWFIWISHYTCKVNVFYGSRGKWKLQKTFPCCVGKWSTRTARGHKKILTKHASSSYGGPILYFSPGEFGTHENPDGCAFHNVINKDMGKQVSGGCVRLYTSALIYLYNNCPVGTAVWSY